MRAIGYIRQSARRDLDLALSPEQQREEIERLATRDGITDLTIFEDLGRSGGEGKERRRRGYQEMVAAVEAGGVEVVYAKALSRLGRSTTELYRFANICLDNNTRITTSKEGSLDPRTPTGKLQFGILAVINEFERDLRVEAAHENNATRRARGETLGRPAYGDRDGDQPERVVAAYKQTRSLNATALLLNAENLPSPLGRIWSGTSVRNVIERTEPEVLPTRRHHGVKPSSPFLFFRLVRCPCGRLLTASRDGRGNREPVYRCHQASIEPDHPRPYRIRESIVTDWAQEEAALLTPPDAVRLANQNAEKRAELSARRERLGWAVADGLLDRAVAAERASSIDAELNDLNSQERVIVVPRINWSWPTMHLNAVLRAMWEYVELDEAMQPVRAKWKVPEWRQPQPPEEPRPLLAARG